MNDQLQQLEFEQRIQALEDRYELEKEKVNNMPQFYGPTDIMEMLDVAKPTAYQIMKELNDELEKDGFLVRAGRVSARYFNERYGLEAKE